MGSGRVIATRAITALASTYLLCVGVVLAAKSSASTDSGPMVRAGALPAQVAGSVAPPALPSSESSAAARPSSTPSAPARRQRPLVPTWIDIPVHTTNHPHGVRARVTSHALNADKTLFVPANPRVVSLARSDAPLGASHGTTIIAGHINFVINGRTVQGAFADLAQYANTAVGKVFTVHTKGGLALKYRIVAGREYSKEQLASQPGLRSSLYDQSKVYGPPGHPSARLLLVSCGGSFDPSSGEYEDNVFLYALPVGSGRIGG